MQVSNLLNPFQAQTGLRTSQSPTTQDLPTFEKIAAEANFASGTDSTFRNVLSQYDVSEITPRQFTMLAQQLFQARAISADDLKELSQMRLMIDQQHADPDGPIDLMEFFGQKLQEQTLATTEQEQTTNPLTNADKAKLTQAQRQFGWVHKFATVQSDSSTESLDTIV